MIRVALFSDIHAAPDALTTFMNDIAEQQVNALWCLGDLVGYGPFPLQVIHLLRGMSAGSSPHVILRGNHDQGMATGRDLFQFDPDARSIIKQQRDHLPVTDLEWLQNLPLFAMPLDGVCLAHGAFVPEREYDLLWVYGSRSNALAYNQLKSARTYCEARQKQLRLIAVGHYHVPSLVQWNAATQRFTDHPVWDKTCHRFEDGSPLIVNPGSITLPREGVEHPTASYALLEIDAGYINISFRPLSWDWRATIRHMRDPYPAGERLRRQMRYAALPPGITVDEDDKL